MADKTETIRQIQAMTDAGAFELLATAVLRLKESHYASLVHPGVNEHGRTVKSPLDNVGFVHGANPPHMVMAQHTTSKVDQLESKWLHDPATVKARSRSGKPTAPAGDLIKAAEIVKAQKGEMPGLRATLALTCSVEVPEDLVRKAVAAGRRLGGEVDVWSASRIAGVLDDMADGQWLRRRPRHPPGKALTGVAG